MGGGLLPLLPAYLYGSIFSHRHYTADGFHNPFPAAKLIGVCCQVESCQAFNYILLGVQSPVGIDTLCVEITAYYYFIAISPNGSAVIIIELTLLVMNSQTEVSPLVTAPARKRWLPGGHTSFYVHLE